MRGRVLTWAQAGHPRLVLVRGACALALEPPAGILLGAGRAAYDAERLMLRPGDLLLLYSDGLVERRDRSIDEGVERLVAALRGAGDPERVVAVGRYRPRPPRTGHPT